MIGYLIGATLGVPLNISTFDHFFAILSAVQFKFDEKLLVKFNFP